jgi:hypothetical protein
MKTKDSTSGRGAEPPSSLKESGLGDFSRSGRRFSGRGHGIRPTALACRKVHSRTVHSPLLVSPSDRRACNIVTLYEDFVSAIRVYQLFEWLEATFSNDLPVTATSWSFQMLGMSRLAASVPGDPAFANVLVVSANGNKDLPAHVAVWVEKCISKERNPEPVLVALVDGRLEAAGAATLFCSSLEQIATRRHARFLRTGDLKAHPNHDFPAELAGDESRGPVRETIGHPALRAPQRCRINE